MAEAINEGKALREQDGENVEQNNEISQDEKDEILDEAMSEDEE